MKQNRANIHEAPTPAYSRQPQEAYFLFLLLAWLRLLACLCARPCTAPHPGLAPHPVRVTALGPARCTRAYPLILIHCLHGHTGVPRPCGSALHKDPKAGLCLGSYGGPRGGRVLMSEVPLYRRRGHRRIACGALNRISHKLFLKSFCKCPKQIRQLVLHMSNRKG